MSKPRRRFHGFRFITLFMAIMVGFELVFAGVAVYGLQIFLETKQEINITDFLSQESTLIFDKYGNEIADVGTQLRENITFDDVPDALIDAFLAIEDSRYFEHNGFDIPRFMKSIIETIVHHNMQGGSTFTMQLVKLTYFTDDTTSTSRTKDIEYKIQQIALAIELEKKVNKKEIFEMYMNKMNFGGIGNIRGVQKAAQQYFGKSVNELNINECVILAGVVNSPYYWDPHLYLDHAYTRRNDVIYQLVNHGYINETQANLMRQTKIEDLLVDPYGRKNDEPAYRFQAYIDEALKEAEELTGLDPLNVSMEIYTEMDPYVQEVMEEIEAGNNPNVNFADDLMECGFICENNQTGAIVGIGGGRNYASGGSMLLNHATEQYKQPGSSIKPWLDYALAFEYLGWATSHTLEDKPVTYYGHTFKNADGVYRGDVSLENCVAWSLNTPAIQTMQAVLDEVGTETVVEYLQSMNLSQFQPELFDIQYSIGGSSFAVSPKELMACHAVLMNGGNYIQPHTIREINFRNGLIKPVQPVYEPVNVLSPQAAYMAAWTMERAVDAPAINYMEVLVRGYETYGKTGTTDWGDSGLQYGIPRGAAKDNWMVAETSEYTIATWVGYEKAVAGEDTYFDRNKTAMNTRGNICSEVLNALYRDYWPEPVQRPEGLTNITHIKGVYPYAQVFAGLPSEYIVTGMVKTEYAKLQTFEYSVEPLLNLGGFNAYMNGDSNYTVTWDSYPDPSKLTVSSKKFTYQWVTGPVRYKVRISQNGVMVGEYVSETNTLTRSIEGLSPGTATQACGYYGYQNTSQVSNEVCTTFYTPEEKKPEPTEEPEIPDDMVYAPGYGTSLEGIQSWAASNNINLHYTYLTTDDHELAGTIELLDGQWMIYGSLVRKGSTFDVVVYSAAN